MIHIWRRRALVSVLRTGGSAARPQRLLNFANVVGRYFFTADLLGREGCSSNGRLRVSGQRPSCWSGRQLRMDVIVGR